MINQKIKFLMAVTVLALIVLAAGCAKTQKEAKKKTDSNPAPTETGTIVRTSLSPDSGFKSELVANPSEVKAGEQANLIFSIKNAQGASVRDLQIVHERPMHLLVVSDDLAEFTHIHPEPQADGTFKVTYTFPSGGGYKLYADFTPPGAKQVVDRYDLRVGGQARSRTPLVEDNSLTKTVGSLTVTMFPDRPLRAGQELMLNFAVADAGSGKPVTDLQKYLGALAHFVVISEDTTEFLHVHPMEANEMKYGEGAMKVSGVKEGETRMPAVSAHTTFPRAGLYKLWAQFQRGGRVITVPFVLRVAEGGAASTARNGSETSMPGGALKVTVSKAGFEPAEISVKKGEPVKIAFYRADAENCAGEVVFPALNIRKGLSVGETTVVEFTPNQSGDLAFACGMGMFNGKLVVNN